MTSSTHEAQLAVRVPQSMLDALDELVPERHSSRAEAIRAAIDAYLYQLACERDAERYADKPLTDDELGLADDPDGWRATPPW